MKALYLKRVPTWIDTCFKEIVWRKKKGLKELYLSFDDGPDPASSYKIASLLKSLDIKATFFCLGQKIDSYPDICHHLIEEGHVLANHNYEHYNGWITNSKDYVNGVVQCQKILEERSFTVRKLFRPPYGKVSARQLRKLRQMDFDVVNWSLMPGDFDVSSSSNTLLKKLLQFQDGDIIVLHDHMAALDKLNQVLPAFVDSALKKGFSFKTL